MTIWKYVHVDHYVEYDPSWLHPASSVCLPEQYVSVLLGEMEKEAALAETRLVPLVVRNQDERYVANCGGVSMPIEPRPFLLDMGGIAMTGRKLFTIDIDGLKVDVPATNVGARIEGLEAKEPPLFSMGPHQLYCLDSMFGWQLWLEKQHGAMLLDALRKISAEAAAITDIENQLFNKQIVGAPYVSVKPRPVRKIEEA